MRTRLAGLVWCVAACGCLLRSAEGGPSLAVTKPPVQSPALLTGPSADAAAAQGQWFIDQAGTETVRANEFYDEIAGGTAGHNAITGYVNNVVLGGGPMPPILAFSIVATVINDSGAPGPWLTGSNTHGEALVISEPYAGPLVEAKLVAEFAVTDATNLPAPFQPPYRDRPPYIIADNEDQSAWYCWNPQDPNPQHQPAGGYYVPAWDFGTIPSGGAATRSLAFSVPGGLLPGDPRYAAIMASFASQADVLQNRTISLKISTWLDDIALDTGAAQEELPLRMSDVSVFHNRYEEEPSWDFGDAPDPTYPALLANNGARHAMLNGFSLGAFVDAEGDGQPDPNALGDDSAGVPDDEDGVAFVTALFSGVPNTLFVTARVPAGVNALLSAWLDLNGDGDWADAGEQILVDRPVVNGANQCAFTPGAITASGSTFARFRLSSLAGLSVAGAAPDGEVEDYEVAIAPVKWMQPPDLSANGVDVDDSSAELADDFRCVMSGPITDLHLWVSFLNDVLPARGLTNVAFTLSLYADVPAGPQTPFSHPGELLWSRKFLPGIYGAGLVSAGTPEWWHDPLQNAWLFPGDTRVYQYDFAIPREEAYVQTEGTVYWVGVRYSDPEPGEARLGWKSSHHHWNDDACWLDTGAGIPTWKELRYGDGHEMAPDSMDLAFAVTGVEGELDLGDAPDPAYPTMLASTGACHTIVPGVYLGAVVDAEPDGQPDATATGDDLAGLDDEDGVTFTSPLYAGGMATATVVCAVGGYLSGWVDFNADGDWADPGENVFAALAVGAGTNPLAFGIPGSAAAGGTFARLRFTTVPRVLGYAGPAPDGEVEDYEVFIRREEPEPVDFGDAWDSPVALGYPTLLINNGARHRMAPGVFLGNIVDTEGDGQPTLNADGDDLNPPAGADDEDGVILPPVLVAGSVVQVQVLASVPGFLNAWVDFNANGTWVDPGEHWVVNLPLNPGTNMIVAPVPHYPATVGGGPHSRWRFTTYLPPVPAFTGLEMDGEVEDYEVHLEVLDFGDAPDPSYPTLLASDGARHRLPSAYWLGAVAPDDDPDGQPDALTLGDDKAGVDDEDGISARRSLVRGANGSLSVVASIQGYLNAWLDFNQDGDWADGGEQVAADLLLAAGTNAVPVAVPPGAHLGPTPARFRFGSARGLSFKGLAADGEVEDLRLTIYQQGPDTNSFRITNVVHVATNAIAIEWAGESNVTYRTLYATNLVSTAAPPWTVWGPPVEVAPYRQTDTNAAAARKFYRVVAPYTLPPP